MPPLLPGELVEVAEQKQDLDYPHFQDLLERGVLALDVRLGDEAAARLFRYFSELKHWGRKVNLISRESSDSAIVENHFIDSLALLSLFGRQQERLLDVGSGAGFPGLVCKAARPDLSVCLLEPRLKRVSFLNHIVRNIGLDNISVLASRLEEGLTLPDEERFTSVVSRAVTDVAGFLSMCGRWCRADCRVICMKGPRFREELQEAGTSIDGWHLEEIKEYSLPFSQAVRTLLVFRGRERR